MANCKNCQKLTKELKDLTEFINALADDIYLQALDAATEIEAGPVPQGRYEYLLATFQTCNDILAKMNRPTAAPPGGSRAGLGAGLFSGLFSEVRP